MPLLASIEIVKVFQSTNEMAATNVVRGNSNDGRTEVLNTSIRSASGN